MLWYKHKIWKVGQFPNDAIVSFEDKEYVFLLNKGTKVFKWEVKASEKMRRIYYLVDIGILFAICTVLRIKFFSLLSYVKEPILLAFSTASSESAMPKTIEQLEKFGISNRIVSFVLPLGYSFNLDGSIMYMTFATVFIAQAYGIDMTMGDQIQMMLILLITSKGMAGVPRASLVVIAGMLSMFHIPGEGLLLLLAVDQILDMGRSATNVVGNAVASAVVAKWEGEKLTPRTKI